MAGRTDVEFRGFPPAEVEAIQKQFGDKGVVRYPKALIHWGMAFNVDQKPFDDERVRKPCRYYEPYHSHWMNRRLEDVWLAKEEALLGQDRALLCRYFRSPLLRYRATMP